MIHHSTPLRVGTRRRAGLFALAAAGVLVATGAPAQAGGATTEVIQDPYFMIQIDSTNKLAFFSNTTREEFCTPEMVQYEEAYALWVEGGQQGKEPQAPDYSPLLPYDAVVRQLPKGTTMVRYLPGAERPAQLWAFDAGVGLTTPFQGPCLDTDEQLAPFAAGTAVWHWNETSDGAGPRTRVAYDHAIGRLSSPEGKDYTYNAQFKFVTHPDGTETVSQVRFQLSGRR
jgi:hypothetical protein